MRKVITPAKLERRRINNRQRLMVKARSLHCKIATKMRKAGVTHEELESAVREAYLEQNS